MRRGAPRGRKSHKRHLLVNTLGLLLVVVVTAASVSKNAGTRLVLTHLGGRSRQLRCIWVNGGYRGNATDMGLFVVQVHCWGERTFVWLTR